MKVGRVLVSSMLATFFGCAPFFFRETLREPLQQSALFQLEIMGVRSCSMLSSAPVSDGQVFWGRTYSLYADRDIVKIYPTDMPGVLLGDPVVALSCGPNTKKGLLEDMFNGQTYFISISEKDGKKLVDFYRIDGNLVGCANRFEMDFDELFISGRFLLGVKKDRLVLYLYEDNQLKQKDSVNIEGKFKVFASHNFESFIVIKENGGCIILGEERGKAEVPFDSESAALYYDGRNKKMYVVVFNLDGDVKGFCEMKY
ncbi:MAG: hypothetical protein QXL47_00400 [Candidatus Anstonellales archaeon]